MNKPVAVITGASGGIGYQTALLFCEKGYAVYGLCRSRPPDERILHIATDVSDEKAVFAAFERIISERGRVDVLVNNAGFGISGAAECTEDGDARRQFDVNFFGLFYCCKAVAGTMRGAGGGKIINITSVAGPLAIPFQAFYSASKAASNAFSMAFGNEVRRFGIQVCAVMPGDIQTGFTAARKKSAAGGEIYGDAVARSVAVMEKDEENGMRPEYAARRIYRIAAKRRLKPLYAVGNKYKLFYFLSKILPAGIVVKVIGFLYVK